MKKYLSALATCTLLAGIACCGSTDGSGAPGPGPTSSSTSSSSSGGTSPLPTSCDAAAARDLEVKSDDLNGYPPYAIAQCSLVYVSTSGDLVLRDLATKSEATLAPASEKPRRPSASIDPSGPNLVIVWESALGVRVRYGDRTSTVKGDFVMATEPRAREHLVAFTAWKGATEKDDADVWLYDARTEMARAVITGPAQQRFADVSPTHVVATDFSEDPDGRFDGENDLADIVIFEIASGTVTRRAAPDKQAFPMLSNGGTLAYLSWKAVHPEPKLQAYELKAGALLGDPAADRKIADVRYITAEPARPALAGEMVEWIANPEGKATLYRAGLDGSTPPAGVSGLDDLFLYAPASSAGTKSAFTVLAAVSASGTDRAPRLHALAR